MTQPLIGEPEGLLERAASRPRAESVARRGHAAHLGAELRRPTQSSSALPSDESFLSAQFDRKPLSIGPHTGLLGHGVFQRRLLELEAKVSKLPALERQVADLKTEVASLRSEVRTAREAASERQTLFEESEELFARIQQAIGPVRDEQEDEPLDAETLNLLLGRGPDE